MFLKSFFSFKISAINYLHRNIFINKNEIKIGDFGISKILMGTKHSKANIGTPVYWSPELHRNEKYDFKSDIWLESTQIDRTASMLI